MLKAHTPSRIGVHGWRRTLIGIGAAVLAIRLTGSLAAQQSGTALPVIEPRLTRIIGADTLKIVEPALSPDGQWVVFSTWNGVGEGYLWIVPSKGGEPRRLIETRNVRDPVWFPSSDRILYWSGENAAIMSVPFDRRSGTVSGRPQRITLEPCGSWYALSPDSRWIAYRRWSQEGTRMTMIIQVIPSNGGTARTVGEPADMVFLADWSADSRYIYYRARTPESPDVSRMYRAAVEGGGAEEVRDTPAGGAAPRLPYRVVQVSDAANGTPPFEVQTYDGRPLARVALPTKATPAQAGRGFITDGRQLLAVTSNQVTVLRVVPVAGGDWRQLGDARASETLLGWSVDGSDVLFATTLDGRSAIMSTPVTGGAAREIGPTPDRGPVGRDPWWAPITFSADGRFVAYSRPVPTGKDRTLLVRAVAGGPERVFTHSAVYPQGLRLVGPGGTPYLAGTDFLYLERNGEEVELRAIAPEGTSSRLLRSFALSDVGLGRSKGVFEDRVAYAQLDAGPTGGFGSSDPVNHPARLMVVRGPTGAPKVVAAVPGVIAFDDIVWSPDGRWIAATTFVNTETNYIKVLVVGVTPDGDVSSPPRLIESGTTGSAWGLRWLPDGSAVTLYGQTGGERAFDVWLIPLKNGGRPVSVTRDDPSLVSFNILSPDGRYLAYQASVERGASLWLADFGDALAQKR